MAIGTKKYSVILSDPPWSFKTYSDKGKGRSAEKHYPVMTKKQIQDLPVNDIAADDCVLFLWITFPCLEEGLELIKKWGFTYKTNAFTWIKKNKKADSLFWGLGYWTRSNSEICLLATKGSPKRIARNVHQVIYSPVQSHSQKPNEVRERIVRLMGDVPRLEMFARSETIGWDVFGNEVENSIKLPSKSTP